MSRAPTMQEKHPELFLPSMNIDRRKCKRVVPMKVLSLGMPRTGTASMQLALNILGFPCYHGLSLFANIRDCEMWNEALDAKYSGNGKPFTREDWDQLLGNYSAVADLPAIAFAEELITAYPEAQVVLVERDVEKWYKSFNEGVIMNVWSPLLHTIARFDPSFVGALKGPAERWTRGMFDASSMKDMQEKARAKYKEHYELVRKVTPRERLLIFDLKDGWAPLCEFLNRPVPEDGIPFPRVNESKALSEKIGLIARRGFVNGLKRNLVLAISLLLLLLLAFLAFPTLAWWFKFL